MTPPRPGPAGLPPASAPGPRPRGPLGRVVRWWVPAGWVGLAACRPEPAPAPAPPDVLLVVLDDVGLDRLGAAGNPLAHTPVLDDLAARGRWYRRAWGYPVCSPARAALQTGRHAPRTGVGANVDDARSGLPGSERTLADVLRPAGYTSVYVGKWHLDPFDARVPWDGGPLAHGYDRFAGTPGNLDDPFAWREVVDGEIVERDRYVTTALADEAVTLAAETPSPWFLTFAPHPPHGPLHAPPPDLHTYSPLGDDPASLVNAMMEATDTELGRVLAALPPETWVVVVGDNGDRFDGNAPGELGKSTLSDAGVGVPLIVAGPGLAAGGPVDDLASVVDVLPTLAALAAVDPGAVDGRSLLDRGGAPPWVATMEFADGVDPVEGRAAARSETHKLLTGPDGDLAFRYAPGASDEGEPLDAPTAEDQAALDGLRAALRGLGAVR